MKGYIVGESGKGWSMRKRVKSDMIPVIDLRAQYHEIRDEIDKAVADVLESGRYILGAAVERLEKEMKDYLSLKAAFGCANGTDALILALMAYEIGNGDEVILPAFTFVAPLEAAVLCGAVPRFIDVDPETFNIEPAAAIAAVSPRTRAIIAVHLFGQCAEIDPILPTVRRSDIVIIEDAAQSFGAECRGRRAGSIGDVSCFSFYPTKNLACMGDGGLVGTRDAGVVDRLRYLRVHGEVEKYQHSLVGMNSRLDEIQAAILLAKLPFVEKWNARRGEIASIYNEAFGELGIRVPAARNGFSHVYHQYTLQVPRREDLAKHLKARNIMTAVHYPIPLPHQPAYREFDPGHGAFPVAERLAREVISLPVYPQLTDGQINRIVEGVRSFFESV